jgi:hypothetical protein
VLLHSGFRRVSSVLLSQTPPDLAMADPDGGAAAEEMRKAAAAQ